MKISSKKLFYLFDFANFKNIKNFYFDQEKKKLITSDNQKFLLEEEKKNSPFFEQYMNENNPLQKEKNLVFQPFYKQIKKIALTKIKNLYNNHIFFINEEQKDSNIHHISFQQNDFFLLLNFYAENKKEIIFFDLKVISSNFLKKLTFFNTETQQNELIFKKNIFNVFQARHETEKMPDSYFGTIKNFFYNLKIDVKNFYNILYKKFFLEKAKLFIEKKQKFFLITLNSDFILKQQKERFDFSSSFPEYSLDVISLIDVSSFLEITFDIFQKKILNTLKILEEDNTQKKISNIYSANIPSKNSIFTLLGHQYGFRDKNKKMHTLIELIENKILHIQQIPDDWLNRPSNIIQKKVIINKKTFIDKEKIILALKSLSYPFYYLDFETFLSPLPRFFGEKPYNQSVFQFSLHIEKKPFQCLEKKDHYHYINNDFSKDCRKEIIQQLLKLIDIKNSGTIIVYNAHFEKSRFREWQQIFPEFHDALEKIINKTFDLLLLLKGNQAFFKKLGFKKSTILFYDEEQQGSYSIKKILPILSSKKINYQNLVINNGLTAMITFAKLNSFSKQEKEQKISDLIDYCRQDTWAMVEILHNLQKMVQN